MSSLGQMASYIGAGAGILTGYLARHPWVVVVFFTLALSGFVGWIIVNLALLVQPFQGLFLVFYLAMAPAAVFSVRSDGLLSRRLWIAMLASVMGLLSFRVIYDLIGLPEGIFRSNFTGVFGLVCGVTGFIKVR